MRFVSCPRQELAPPDSDPPPLPLPPEVLLVALAFLAPRDVSRVSATSAAWRECADDDAVWRPLCRRRWRGKQRHALTASRVATLERAHALVATSGFPAVALEDDDEARVLEDGDAAHGGSGGWLRPLRWSATRIRCRSF